MVYSLYEEVMSVRLYAVDGYSIVENDRKRNGGSVASYIRDKICSNRKACISDNIENIFIDLLFPKMKTLSLGIIYKPPSQTQFLEQIITEFVALSTLIMKFTFLEILI